MTKQASKKITARVSLMGTPRAIAADGAQVAFPEKAYSLMAFLALAGQGHFASRGDIACFLWPEAPRPKASGALRQLISRIRRAQDASGADLIASTSFHVRLKVDGAWFDVLALRQLIGEASWTNLPETLELYGNGQLLAGGSAEEESPEWVGGWREYFRESFTTAVMGLLNSSELAAHTRLAQAAAQRVLEIDPYHEPALQAQMRAYAAEGRSYEARRVFDQYSALFRSELGVGPNSETVDTFNTLMEGGQVESDDRDSASAPAASTVSPAEGGAPVPDPTGMPKIAILEPARGHASHDLHDVAASLLEDVTLGLCSLRTIMIIAPHTSWHLGSDPQMQCLVEQFGLTYLVESNLHVLHGSNSLSLKLLDAQSRAIIWAKRVPLGHLQLAESYREICVGLVPSIADALERAEIKRHESVNDRAAYYWYLQGQRHLRQIDLPNIRRARRAFQNAISSGAAFAPAYSGAARTVQMEWILLARGDLAALAKSEKLARRAIELDPRDSGGYHQLGFASLYIRRFDESIAHFTQAERRHPQHADLLADFADALAHSGNPTAGLKKLQQAMALNPIVPDQYWWRASGMNYQLHRYDEAINCALRMNDSGPAWRLMAASYAQLGEKTSAREYVEKTLETYPDFRVEHWLSIVPNRNPDDVRHYKEGLRLAGFP